MFFELLSDCTIRSFSKALVSNSQELIKCVSLTNRPCEVRPTLIKINSNESFFDSFTVSVNKSGVSCNTTDYPYAQVCLPNKMKNMNLKLSRVNETRFLVQHQSCECKCRFNGIVCNSKQKWNNDWWVKKSRWLRSLYKWLASVIVNFIRHKKLLNI